MPISVARAVHVPAEEREVCHQYGYEDARQAIYQHTESYRGEAVRGLSPSSAPPLLSAPRDAMIAHRSSMESCSESVLGV